MSVFSYLSSLGKSSNSDKILSFHTRQLITNPEDFVISSRVICAERPDLSKINAVIGRIQKESPNVQLTEHFHHLNQSKKIWDKQKFETALTRIITNISHTASALSWQPSEKEIENLHDIHLLSNDGVLPTNDWLVNLELQIRAIRLCHLRSIAKKGDDLDGTTHFEARYISDDNPDNIARITAATEVLSTINMYDQAAEIIRNALNRRLNTLPSGITELHIVRPIRDYKNSNNSFNFQTATYARILLNALITVADCNFSDHKLAIVDKPVTMLTFTNRTNASLFGRLLKLPVFDVRGLEDKNVVVIDDHINAGGFSLTLSSQAQEQGANLVGIAAYSRHAHASTPYLAPSVKEALVSIYSSEKINSLLRPVGLCVDTLSNREALTLLSIFIDGKDEAHCEDFRRLNKELCGEYITVTQGIDDDLEVQLAKPKEIITSLKKEMGNMLKTQEKERTVR